MIKLHCARCGYDWLPRIPTPPIECPACKSRKWRDPKPTLEDGKPNPKAEIVCNGCLRVFSREKLAGHVCLGQTPI